MLGLFTDYLPLYFSHFFFNSCSCPGKGQTVRDASLPKDACCCNNKPQNQVSRSHHNIQPVFPLPQKKQTSPISWQGKELAEHASTWGRQSDRNLCMTSLLCQRSWAHWNVPLHVGSCQPTAWGWRWGTPGNQSKLNYLSADNDRTISFLGSSQNVRGKKLKAWTFLMRAIIESSVTQSICFGAFQWLVKACNAASPCGSHRTTSFFFEEELMIFIYHAHHLPSLTVLLLMALLY